MTEIERNKIAVLIVAAGRGHRAGEGLPKQYRKLAGQSVLRRTIERFQSCGLDMAIRCVIHRDDGDLYKEAVSGLSGLLEPVYGGETRQHSVINGLHSFNDDPPEKVLIHDAARPFVTPDVIVSLLDEVTRTCGAIAANGIVDTLKREGDARQIAGTVSREGLWAAQTPQGFWYSSILDAHERAMDAGVDVTDDAAIAEWAGLPVHLVESGRENLKLTTERDFTDAEQRMSSWKSALPDIRTGHGYDVHAFEPGTEVILGGVQIPHDKKLKGHSDADVALHTITDAIYGALADGDIGHHFPPSDLQWKGAASDLFLKHAVSRVRERGGFISNVDLTIICEKPKIGPHRAKIQVRLSEIMDLDPSRISVKATTTELLGFTGRSEGIAATATATVILPPEAASNPWADIGASGQ